jgi:hypothetical protein
MREMTDRMPAVEYCCIRSEFHISPLARSRTTIDTRWHSTIMDKEKVCCVITHRMLARFFVQSPEIEQIRRLRRYQTCARSNSRHIIYMCHLL